LIFFSFYDGARIWGAGDDSGSHIALPQKNPTGFPALVRY
jgi:hypothetical protein